jgi:hypothetical protein
MKIHFCCCCFVNKSKTTTWNKSKQKHWFFNKLHGFCCFAYQNKQKIKSSIFFRDLYIQKNFFTETERNVVFQETKRNGTIFFETETENRNEINIFLKRNGTKRKKITIFNPLQRIYLASH